METSEAAAIADTATLVAQGQDSYQIRFILTSNTVSQTSQFRITLETTVNGSFTFENQNLLFTCT